MITDYRALRRPFLICGGINMWKGIDVSDNQGVIEWGKVASSGVQFAVLRSVRRSGKADYQFAANLAGCQRYGIPESVYKYTYATSQQAAETEARQVVELLQGHGLKDTMVWWDVEDRENLQQLGMGKLTECIKAAQEVIEASGYRFGIYVGLYVYQEGWFDFNQFASVPLWIARYYNGYNVMQFQADPDQSRQPDVNRAIWGWQYTSTGRVPGISGNADLDICYQDPAGTTDAGSEPGTIWCLSIADVWDAAIAREVAAAYPGCIVHKAAVLDAGGIEIWIASIADVWTQAQAGEVKRQFAALGVSGVVHNIRVLE